MSSIWFSAAAGLILVICLLRLFFRTSGPKEQRLSGSSRTAAGLSIFPQQSSDEQKSAKHFESAQGQLPPVTGESVLPLAGMPPLLKSAPLSSDRRTAVSVPAARAAGTGEANSDSGEPAATIPLMADRSHRHSTWEHRRLFHEFNGILADRAATLPLAEPEELPVRSEDLLFGSATPALAQMLPESAARREIQRKSLTGAGYLSRAAWLNLTAVRFVLAFLSLVAIGLALLAAPPELEPWLMAAWVAVPLLMWALPPLIVAWQAAERTTDVERGLPDVLDILNMGVSQGLNVPQSLNRISRDLSGVHPALAEELRIVTHQAEVGSLPQALRNFSRRIESPEVNSFTSLLIQSESTGTSISRSLAEYSDSMRSTLKERADARANAASFKLLFPVALCLMPSVFLFLLGPAIVQMSDFFANQGRQLQENRDNAIRTLDQQPRLNNAFNADQNVQGL